MTIPESVYPSAIADKCVALLCEHEPALQAKPRFLSAARFLMIGGFVARRPDAPCQNAASFVVQSPDTPRYYYSVDWPTESCSCAAYLRLQRPCQHILAVALTILAHYHFGC